METRRSPLSGSMTGSVFPVSRLGRSGCLESVQGDAPTLKLVPFAEGPFKVKAFLDPILDEDGEGQWEPGAGLWAL